MLARRSTLALIVAVLAAMVLAAGCDASESLPPTPVTIFSPTPKATLSPHAIELIEQERLVRESGGWRSSSGTRQVRLTSTPQPTATLRPVPTVRAKDYDYTNTLTYGHPPTLVPTMTPEERASLEAVATESRAYWAAAAERKQDELDLSDSCSSAWANNTSFTHASFELQVRDFLRDHGVWDFQPASIDFFPSDNGHHVVALEFLVEGLRYVAIGAVDKATCKATILSIDE